MTQGDRCYGNTCSVRLSRKRLFS